MAIIFTQEGKKQRYLILAALIIFSIVLMVWLGFFGKREAPLPPLVSEVSQKKIEIDWEVLKDPRIEELRVFEEISSFEGEIGRENPFIPY